MMDLSLAGKTALVGGSTHGIGRAVAFELAGLGASVVLIARNETALKETITELPVKGDSNHSYLVADFSKPAEVEVQAKSYIDEKDPIHIVINNTGGPKGGLINEAEISEFEKALSMHLKCNHLIMQACLSGMKEAGYGRFINIISTSVKEPIKGLGVSNTTRWAVAAWAKTLSNELGKYGITVNNVLPGATETGRLKSLIEVKAQKEGKTIIDIENKMKETIPACRFGKPEEIAFAVAFLASPAASYINGINLPVDGGRLSCL